jgi:hypothetical protein
MSVVAVTLFAVPALVIAACYVVIVATIWRQGRTLQPPQKGASIFSPLSQHFSFLVMCSYIYSVFSDH